MMEPNVFPSGVVTLLQFTMFDDGAVYQYVWAKNWTIVTNKASGIEGFRSVERWHAVAYSADGTPLVIIPGCQVKAFVACDKNPSLKGGCQIYSVENQ